jgi:hypothetical protein
MRDGAKARFDGVALKQRAENPGAKQSRGHAGDGSVERGEQRGGTAARRFFGEDGIDQLEIANGNGIEDQRIVLLIVANAVEVAKSFECRRAVAVLPIALIAPVCRVFAEIVDDGSRRGNGLRVGIEAEAG